MTWHDPLFVCVCLGVSNTIIKEISIMFHFMTLQTHSCVPAAAKFCMSHNLSRVGLVTDTKQKLESMFV